MGQDSESKNWFQTLPGVLTGLAAVVGAITALIVAFSGAKGLVSNGKTEPSTITAAQKVESCALRPGYPLGRWGVSIQSATPATYSDFITFTGLSSGVWLNGSFETSVALAPGKAVVITLKTEPGTYTSKNQLVVSADGCSMTGTFLDTEDHRGEVFYRWQGDK